MGLSLAINSMAQRIITLEELSKHKSDDDMWMAINGSVYDVTNFLDDHPGGDEVMRDVAGMDATDEFDDIGHSQEAVDMLVPMLVGTLENSPSKSTPAAVAKAPETKKKVEKETGPAPRWQRIALPLLVILLTIVLRYVVVHYFL